MSHNIQMLLEALQLVAGGQEIQVQDVRNLKFDSNEKEVESFATETWRRLRNFADDEDIRKDDLSYDRQMRFEMSWRYEKLTSFIQN